MDDTIIFTQSFIQGGAKNQVTLFQRLPILSNTVVFILSEVVKLTFFPFKLDVRMPIYYVALFLRYYMRIEKLLV